MRCSKVQFQASQITPRPSVKRATSSAPFFQGEKEPSQVSNKPVPEYQGPASQLRKLKDKVVLFLAPLAERLRLMF